MISTKIYLAFFKIMSTRAHNVEVTAVEVILDELAVVDFFGWSEMMKLG